MDQEKLYNVGLGLVPGVGNIISRQLLSYCGSAEAVFKSTKTKLLKIPGIGETLATNILHPNALVQAEKELTLAQNHQVEILFYTDKEYPERLKQVHLAPALLYHKGKADLNSTKTVAIVGTRQATDYGRAVTEELVAGLAKHQALIISGLAYGIDIAAHKAAMKNNLPTVGVMASGIDIIYPAAHRPYAKQMLDTDSSLLTENPFGTRPDAPQFPARNRIIAALCDALIVVEAANKGGALITAEIAHSYNKDLFAVPGNLHHKYSEGCNNLIRDHKASILTCIEDLEKSMNWDLQKPTAPPQLSLFNEASFSEEEQKVISILRADPEILVDKLAWDSGIASGKLASILLSLEFQDVIRSLPGKKYMLIKK